MRLICLVCMIYMETCESGLKTVKTIMMRGLRRTGPRGRVAIVIAEWCAAAPVCTARVSPGPRPAAAAPPETGATTLGSVWPGT